MTPTGLTRTELEAAGRKVLRKNGKQILLLATGGQIYAIANRCPHEGYPLSEGTEGPGAVLTCNWHNWKFDLSSGNALVGRDPVRTYPLDIREGAIYIDLADPAPGQLCARALSGLDQALADYDPARMAREVARLERAGFGADDALLHACEHLNDRFEDGMTHAHAAAADWLALADRAGSPPERLAASLEPLVHLSWDCRGGGSFPYPEGRARWDDAQFVAAVEDENEAAAQALVAGALDASIPYREMRPVFAEAALAHYADFGHSAIYVLKAGQLIERLGPKAAPPVLKALVRSLVRATREERIPEFRAYAGALGAWSGKGREPARWQDFVGLSIDGALARTLQSSGRDVREVYDALLGAAGWNLLHFDMAVDAATDNAFADDVGWLDFTHALTFANACRHLCGERPALWPQALLQLALFVGRNKKYVTDDVDEGAWQVDDAGRFLAREMAMLFDHGIPEPIIVCHRLKVLFALADEIAASPDAPWRALLCAGVNRYLHSPLKRRHSLRIASQALEFVGKEA